MVCVPLRRHTETAGVLCVTSSWPRAFGDRDVETLTGLADFISFVISLAVDLAGVTDTLLAEAHGDAAVGVSMRKGAEWTAEQRFVANVLNPGAVGRFEREAGSTVSSEGAG